MKFGGGCLKNGCLGCLGILVLMFLVVGVNVLIVANRDGEEKIVDRVVRAYDAEDGAPLADAELTPDAAARPAPGRGWLILELGQGEFRIHPGEPGSGIVVKANYDESIFTLDEYSHTWPDSSWVYHVRFGRTISGLQAILREVMGGSHAAQVHVYVAPDLAVELNLAVKEGALDAELGGLWLTDMDVRYDKAGVALHLESPLREPIGSLVVNGRMGGCELAGVGHASPRSLTVRTTMGGTAVDLAGDWRNDCDARLAVTMGGLQLLVPDNLQLVDAPAGGLVHADAEVPAPKLRILEQKTRMGEIEID